MRTCFTPALLASSLLTLFALGSASGATTIISDNYTVTTTTTGWALDTGVNFGINPPTTRLTGTAAANLRYIDTITDGRGPDKYGISNNRLLVKPGGGVGRFALAADDTTPFDFATALGTVDATPANPVVYDIKIAMRNDADGIERLSFGLATEEGDVNKLDFGVQLVHADAADSFYTIYKRIDRGSFNGTATADGTGDVNAIMATTANNTTGQLNNIMIRVTDAGSESGMNYNSRVQVSLNNGSTWVYDTDTDSALPNGWRLDGPGRVFVWDQAPNDGNVFYDNFSVVRQGTATTALVSPPDNALGLGPVVTLTAAASNSVPGDLTVTFYAREAPKPYPGSDFCIAVLPDTQNYAREAAGNGDAKKEMWFAQTDWIVSHRVSHNIVYVAGLGDIVQNGDRKDGNPNTTEWRNATNAMYRLENPTTTGLADGIPYGMAVGNHDQEPMGDEDGTTTHFNQYFGVSHFAGRSYYGGHYGDNNDSHYGVFSASGLDFIVLFFEYGRYGSGVLDWANGVLASHPNHRAIVVTHHAGSDRTPSSFSAQGSALYNGLKAKTNFFMMLGGHVAANGGEGSRSDTYLGRTVRTLISDYQGWMNGGNGYMRLMYFSPSNSTVTIKTYSPWLNQYKTDANSQMSFAYQMPLPSGPGSAGTPYIAVGTNTGVAPNTLSSFPWTGVQAKKSYDWYVKVADATGNTVTSAEWQFTTLAKFAPNAPPVAGNPFLMIPGDAPAVLTLPATDPNGDPLTFQITSEPLNGSIMDFNPGTGTLTYLPVRGYRGPDRISFVASDGMDDSPIASVNLSLSAPPDANANGLPDAWETLYGVADPDADEDGDGSSNLAEYRANTNPTNAASALRILSVENIYTGDIDLVWTSVGGTRYRVQYSDGDAGGGLTGPFIDILRFLYDEMDPAPYGEASLQSFSDVAPASKARFYRIRTVP
ncbi:MAG TPA: Ig-like domain-containing protein [Candidatus Paceibacterota bacterium]|nr:Ig-like domain-containing protein [Verrucomicrobiota bacterium]HSA11380.1 Ig-like domain-containing protein [Candidatus Paceibacterota bacterium]